MEMSPPRQVADKHGLPCVILGGFDHDTVGEIKVFVFGGLIVDMPEFDPYDTVYEVDVPNLRSWPLGPDGLEPNDEAIWTPILDTLEVWVGAHHDSSCAQPERIKTAMLSLSSSDLPIIQAALKKMKTCERIRTLQRKLDGYVASVPVEGERLFAVTLDVKVLGNAELTMRVRAGSPNDARDKAVERACQEDGEFLSWDITCEDFDWSTLQAVDVTLIEEPQP